MKTWVDQLFKDTVIETGSLTILLGGSSPGESLMPGLLWASIERGSVFAVEGRIYLLKYVSHVDVSRDEAARSSTALVNRLPAEHHGGPMEMLEELSGGPGSGLRVVGDSSALKPSVQLWDGTVSQLRDAPSDVANALLIVLALRRRADISSSGEAADELNDMLSGVYRELAGPGHGEESRPISPMSSKSVDTPYTPSLYPAFKTTYGVGGDSKEVLLIISEPEAFVHQSVASTIRHVTRPFTEESDNLFVVVTTHCWGLNDGVYRSGADRVSAYGFGMCRDKVAIEPIKDELYIPGFSTPALPG